MNEMSIAFKDEKIFWNFCKVPLHINLKDFIIWFRFTFGEPFITSAHRNNRSGIHNSNPLRAIDVRSYIYSSPENVVTTTNKVWIYDPDRPDYKCAILHNVGYGMHIHLQVHDNTRKA